MDSEEFEDLYSHYYDYRETNNPRTFHLLDYLDRFGPWWEYNRCNGNYRYHLRENKYKSQRKGRC